MRAELKFGALFLHSASTYIREKLSNQKKCFFFLLSFASTRGSSSFTFYIQTHTPTHTDFNMNKQRLLVEMLVNFSLNCGWIETFFQCNEIDMTGYAVLVVCVFVFIQYDSNEVFFYLVLSIFLLNYLYSTCIDI